MTVTPEFVLTGVVIHVEAFFHHGPVLFAGLVIKYDHLPTVTPAPHRRPSPILRDAGLLSLRPELQGMMLLSAAQYSTHEQQQLLPELLTSGTVQEEVYGVIHVHEQFSDGTHQRELGHHLQVAGV